MLSLMAGMIKYFQSTQSNKLPISSKDLQKEVRNGVHFFLAVKHQIGIIILMEVTRHVQSIQNSNIFAIY